MATFLRNRENRQKEALIRNDVYARLSIDEKLSKLIEAPGAVLADYTFRQKCKRQYDKLVVRKKEKGNPSKV